MLNNRILSSALIIINSSEINIDLPNFYLALIALIHLLLSKSQILIYSFRPKLYNTFLFKIIENT